MPAQRSVLIIVDCNTAISTIALLLARHYRDASIGECIMCMEGIANGLHRLQFSVQ
jgi:NADH:ubiquinone oxidoreductase subunit F (NADH-binding)